MNDSADPQFPTQSSVPSLAQSPVEPPPPIPMTFGQILDRTFRLLRAHWRTLCAIAAVPSAVAIVFMAVWMGLMFPMMWPQIAGQAAGQPPAPPVIPPLSLLTLLTLYPVFFAIYALYMPAIAFASTQADLGVSVTFRQAYGVACRRFWRSLWLFILCALYFVVPMVAIAVVIGVAAGLMSLAQASTAGPASAFFLIPLIVLLYISILAYAIFIMLRFAVAFPASVEEDLSAWASLKRSAQLTRGAKGRIFLVMLVVYAVTYAATLVCMLVLFAVAALVALGAMSAHVALGSTVCFVLIGIGVLVYSVLLVVLTALCYAAFTLGLAVLYHDQRFRKDNLALRPVQG